MAVTENLLDSPYFTVTSVTSQELNFCLNKNPVLEFLEQLLRATELGIGLSYRSARLHNRLAELIPWNIFLGSLKV